MIKSLILTLVFLLSPVFAQESQDATIKLSEAMASGSLNDCVIDRTIAQTKIKSYKGEEFNISSISYEYLDEIFDFLASQEHIPFKYPEDGCYARAHEMARLIEGKGIIAGKVFIEGDLRVETSNSPKGFVEWWYHVAPIVIVKNKSGEELVYVIDPSIFDKPVLVFEWYNIQTKGQNSNKDKKYYTPRFIYSPIKKDYKFEKFQEPDLKNMKSTMVKFLEIQKVRQKQKEQLEQEKIKKQSTPQKKV